MKNSFLFGIGRVMAPVLFFVAQTVRAVILFGSGDPAYNTTPPSGAFQDSGWQYQGQWGGFLGTPIAPQYFIAARHVGGSVGQTFTFNGVSYTTTACWNDPYSDLRIWKVSGVFPTYAPLYASSDEMGKTLVVIGRGTQRGAPVTTTAVETNYTTTVTSNIIAVIPVYTTNVVDLAALKIPVPIARQEFPNATFKGPVMTVVTCDFVTNTTGFLAVVTPVYTTNVVDLKSLGITPKQAQQEFPDAIIKGQTMTEVTCDFVTNMVDLNALGIDTAQAAFPDDTFTIQTSTSITSSIATNTLLKGWQAGASDGVMRWGQNKVYAAGSCLVGAFTGTLGANEAYLSGGDSSGAVFLQDSTGVWKLAGINYGVDGPFATSSATPAFFGAIFDEDGLYVNGALMPSDDFPRPAYFYATRISQRLGWIQSIIGQ